MLAGAELEVLGAVLLRALRVDTTELGTDEVGGGVVELSGREATEPEGGPDRGGGDDRRVAREPVAGGWRDLAWPCGSSGIRSTSIDVWLQRTRRDVLGGWVSSFDADDLSVHDPDLDPEIAVALGTAP